METVSLLISENVETNLIYAICTENSIFMSNKNNKMSEMENDREAESFKRYDFNHAPPKQSMKCNVSINEVLANPKKSAMSHVMGDDFDKKQNSTNSNSPISVTSLDEIFDSDQKNGSLHQKASFFPTHHSFNDDKSSGTSSLFSSGI